MNVKQPGRLQDGGRPKLQLFCCLDLLSPSIPTTQPSWPCMMVVGFLNTVEQQLQHQHQQDQTTLLLRAACIHLECHPPVPAYLSVCRLDQVGQVVPA